MLSILDSFVSNNDAEMFTVITHYKLTHLSHCINFVFVFAKIFFIDPSGTNRCTCLLFFSLLI